LGLTDLCATDILQLLVHMDTDRDGNISLPEFTHALRRQLDTSLGLVNFQYRFVMAVQERMNLAGQVLEETLIPLSHEA